MNKYIPKNRYLKLGFLYDRQQDMLIPLAVEEFKKGFWIANLKAIDNRELLENIPYDPNKPCLLIDANCGLVIDTAKGRKRLIQSFKGYYQEQLEKFQEKKLYGKYCADFYAKVAEFNETYRSEE